MLSQSFCATSPGQRGNCVESSPIFAGKRAVPIIRNKMTKWGEGVVFERTPNRI